MAHTPGPWTWWTSNSWRRLKHDDRGKSVNVLEPYVCKDGQPDIIVSEEDMPLIEAAPDLLEALQLVLGYLNPLCSCEESSGCRAASLKAICRAAIAKAKGQREARG